MKKIFSIFAALLFAGGLFAESASETLTCTAGTIDNDAMTFTTSNFTIVHAKGEGTTLNSYTPWRVYANNTITITGNKFVAGITKVEFVHATGKDYIKKNFTASKGTFTLATESGGTSVLDNLGTGTTSVTLTEEAGSGHDRFTSITITYEKAVITDPAISVAPSKDFGVVPVGAEKAEKIEVVGMNLTQAIVASLASGTQFATAGTLTKTGGELTVTAKPTAAGDISEDLTLAAGSEASAKVTLTVKAVATTGKGTATNPFLCGDLVALDNGWAGVYWVKGYIVENNENDVALASAAGDEKQVSVQLSKSSPLRTALNPEVGMLVYAKGSLEKYNSLPGVKSLEAIQTTVPTGVENIQAAPKAMKTLYNGQVVIIRDGVRYNTVGQVIE